MTSKNYFAGDCSYFSTSTEKLQLDNKDIEPHAGYSVINKTEYSPPKYAPDVQGENKQSAYPDKPIKFTSYPSSGVKKRKFSFSK